MASFGLASVPQKVAAMFGRACGKNELMPELSLDDRQGSKQEEKIPLSSAPSSQALTTSPSDDEGSTGLESSRSSLAVSTAGSAESLYQVPADDEEDEDSECGGDSEEEEEEEEPAEEEETKAPSPKEAVLGAAQAKQVADPALARLAASTDAGDVISAVRAAWKAADAAEKEATARRRPNRTELTRVIDCMWDLMGTENEAEECVVKLLIRAIDLLYRCGFPVEDVCSVLAHASIYFVDVLEFCGPRMESREAGNILVVLMYLAHSYVMDEACPLKTWHSNLFRGYCSVGTLNAAAMKLLEVRGWVLRVEPDELARRYELLMQVSEKETAAR